MSFDPLYAFVFAGLFTPGPNVVLLTASGAQFGLLRTVPHIVGVALGVAITAGLTGLGIATLLLGSPVVSVLLRLVAATWILWMAWKLIGSSQRPETEVRARPFTMSEAILFQWVNPKVWMVELAAASGYASGLGPWDEAVRLATAFGGINLGVCLFWTAAGALLARLLSTDAAWRRFRFAMGALLAISAGLVFL